MRTGLKVVVCLWCAAFVAGLAWSSEEGKPVTGVRPWKVSLSLRADYTDNRDSEDDSVAQDTFDLYVKPRFDLFVNPDRTLFDVFVSPSWRYRTDPSPTQNEDEFWYEAGLSLEHSFTPVMTGFVRERLDYTDDSSVDNQGNVARGDMSYILSRTEAGVMYDLTQTWSADLTGGYRDKSYDDNDVADDNNETRADAEGKLSRHMSPTLDVYGLARYSDFGYDSSIGLQRDFNSVVLAVGFGKKVSASLNTGAAVGWQGQDFEDDSIDDNGIPYATAWANWRTIPSMRFGGEATHALRDADVYPYASQEYTELRLSCEYDLTGSTMVGLAGMYRYSDYGDYVSGTTPDAEFETANRGGTEDRYSADLTLAYKLSPQTRLSLIQSYEERDSEVSNDFTKNTTKLIFGREF
jgi:hypothetical protein